MSPRSLLLVVLCLCRFGGWPAAAHELGLVQVEGRLSAGGTYTIDLLVDQEHLAALPAGSPAGEDFLRALGPAAVLSFDGRSVAPGIELAPSLADRPGFSRVRLAGRVPPGATRFVFANAAIPGFYVLQLGLEGQESRETQWVEGGKDSAPFALDAERGRAIEQPSRWRVAARYAGLGFQHIVPRGLDHVLFVLALFLLGARLRPLLWQITAFTLAHTTSLALAIGGVVALPAAVVEPLIALSIAYVAVENLFVARLTAWRPLVVFGFGLLHGLGFAGVLSEIGLPRSELVPALVGFNLGVEAGQLAVVLVAFLALGVPFRAQPWYRRRVTAPACLLLAAVGLYWSVERLSLV